MNTMAHIIFRYLARDSNDWDKWRVTTLPWPVSGPALTHPQYITHKNSKAPFLLSCISQDCSRFKDFALAASSVCRPLRSLLGYFLGHSGLSSKCKISGFTMNTLLFTYLLPTSCKQVSLQQTRKIPSISSTYNNSWCTVPICFLAGYMNEWNIFESILLQCLSTPTQTTGLKILKYSSKQCLLYVKNKLI